MSRGGARPNSGRKKTGLEYIYIRVPAERAEEIRAYAKEHNVSMAEAVEVIVKEKGVK